MKPGDLKDRLEQLKANMQAEYARARALLEYPGQQDTYWEIRAIVIGMQEDLQALESLIKDIPQEPSLQIAAGQQPLGLEVES